MKKVLFSDLWNNHPYPGNPCEKKLFLNQCAIRMGVAIEKSGVDTTSFDKVNPNRRCYPSLKHCPKHILGAEELANWIKSKPEVFGIVQVYKDRKISDFYGRKGIVFVKNGWGSTDHIDVWNGSSMKGGFEEYLEIGEELWFWEMGI